MSTGCFVRNAVQALLSLGVILGGVAGLPGAGIAQPTHGIAMYGDPALPIDFAHLPYANPDAPTGGRIVTGETGSFDSLNPHILQGSTPWQLRLLAYESLLGRSWDEPFTLYGLLAESVEVAEDHTWVEFSLRPEARFSDGSPVTVADVIWSMETLGTVGHPRYLNAWTRVAGIVATGERSLRITFVEPDRELAMIMGLRPILKAEQWEARDFTRSGLDVIPIASAPYVIDRFEAGRFLSLRRDPDYWGADLPFRRGTNVIDEIRMEFFADGTAMFEAFTAGIVSSMRETSAQAWAERYDFPRVRSGEVLLAEIPHQRPAGMTGLVMNTRRAAFADWRVRDAMIHAFPAEFINQTLNGGVDPRITSYFANSTLAMPEGPLEGALAGLLAPFATDLLPGALEGYAVPVSDGTARNRTGIATALTSLEEAGFTVQNGQMRTPEGSMFVVDILMQTGSAENDAIVTIYAEALGRLGITANVSRVDAAQFRERRDAFDFDMIYERYGLSLSPGNEQFSYWGCDVADTPGTRNLMGACNPAIEALIGRMLTSDSSEDYVHAVQALDRVLTSMRYVVPFWHNPVNRIAHDARLRYPDTIPIYGDWVGWQPDVWWVEP